MLWVMVILSSNAIYNLHVTMVFVIAIKLLVQEVNIFDFEILAEKTFVYRHRKLSLIRRSRVYSTGA